jgi:hypothetical protein
MTQLGEAVAFAQINAAIGKCPFNDPDPPADPHPQDEHFAWDDSLTMATAQANSGSKLGTNVENASPGSEGTWNVVGGDPPRYEAAQVDTARAPGKPMVKVGNKNFPFTVAAHHLIPGNASLYESQLYKCYMKKDGKMEVTTPQQFTFTVSRNIGYCVNGSHNGVWLPGSYAIDASNHPSGTAWSVAIATPTGQDWCYEYMAAVSKKVGGQFHDAHTNYNTNALKVLEKLAVKLAKHQVMCNDCKSKKKVPPPYTIKMKLYRLSRYFRTQCLSRPKRWKAPWMTSDQVATDIFAAPTRKKDFLATYDAS